jgi:hypothetical protein
MISLDKMSIYRPNYKCIKERGVKELFTFDYQLEKLFGITGRTRRKKEEREYDPFERPLLHRQIKGDAVYIPLDTERLWGWKKE